MILIQATVAQIKALELEKKIQADRRRKSKEDERFVAQQLIKVRRSGSRLVQRHSCVTLLQLFWFLMVLQKDLADLECEHEKQRAAKRKQAEYRKCVSAPPFA